MDYFLLFNLPRKFKIDINVLTDNFYKLQLKFHPDLFINASIKKKEIVLKKSIEINEGYTILKDSLSRAIHLLFLYNLKINKEKKLFFNKKFLKKYFLFYEKLELLKKCPFDQEKYRIFSKTIQKKINSYETCLEENFKNKNWNKIIEIILKLRFFKNINTHLQSYNTSFN